MFYSISVISFLTMFCFCMWFYTCNRESIFRYIPLLTRVIIVYGCMWTISFLTLFYFCGWIVILGFIIISSHFWRLLCACILLYHIPLLTLGLVMGCVFVFWFWKSVFFNWLRQLSRRGGVWRTRVRHVHYSPHFQFWLLLTFKTSIIIKSGC